MKCYSCGVEVKAVLVESGNDPVFTNDPRISFVCCLVCSTKIEAWYNSLPADVRARMDRQAQAEEGIVNS